MCTLCVWRNDSIAHVSMVGQSAVREGSDVRPFDRRAVMQPRGHSAPAITVNKSQQQLRERQSSKLEDSLKSN